MACEVEFIDPAGPEGAALVEWLERDEVENAMFLGVLAASRTATSSPPALLRVVQQRTSILAAILSEVNLLVSRGPAEAIDRAARAMQQRGLDVPGVLGPAAEAEHFARVWARGRGCEPYLVHAQRIYELATVQWPPSPGGSLRALRPEDLDLVTPWGQAFALEALGSHERRSVAATRDQLARRIGEGNLFGWEAGGELVAMAGLARPSLSTISINSVYTPPELRRRGYATALVAAVSAEGLRRGKRLCVLYTDVSNPTSNSIYQRIGYRPVSDSANYRFRSP